MDVEKQTMQDDDDAERVTTSDTTKAIPVGTDDATLMSMSKHLPSADGTMGNELANHHV